MNNYITTTQLSNLRETARKNGNAVVYYPNENVTFKVAFYDNANLLKVSIEKRFKKPLQVVNTDVLTDETLRVIINSYFKRALKAD